MRKITILLTLGFILLLAINVSGAYIHTYTEDFDTDIVGANPIANFYTYTEHGWTYANVINTTYKDTPNCYWINDTDGKATDFDYSLFNYDNHNYDYFEFWFKWDNNTNTGANAYLLDTQNRAFIDIDFGVTADTLKVSNYSDVGIESILTNDTWYRLKFNFNATNLTWCRLYNSAGALLNSTELAPDTFELCEFNRTNFDKFKIQGVDTKNAFIYFDLLTAVWTENRLTDDSSFDPTEILLLGLIAIIIIIAFIASIIKDITNKKVDKDKLIKKVVLVIIFCVVIGIIITLI